MKIARENIYFHSPYRILLKRLDEIAEMRLNCEIYVDGNALDAHTDEEIGRINSTFEKFGLAKILHGPFFDLNPGSRDARARDFACERIISSLQLCKKFGVGHIVLHTGLNPIYYKNSLKLFLDLSIPVWREILKAAGEGKITIALENSIDTTPEIIVGLIKEFNSPNLEACFDAGHYNAFGERSVFECLEGYPAGSIGELHLSDNTGTFDDHLALGEGNIDYGRIFAEIEKRKESPILTCEPHTFDDIEKNLNYLHSLNI